MENKGALSGLRVLDLTRILAGPYCTMLLADMGAEVIKIEQPKKGDDTRQYAPQKNGESLYFVNINRNKKGVTLDLKNPKGKALFLKMLKDADIVVENYRPGTMEKLGLGYEELKKVNPRVIYAAISGFGHTGRYKMLPGYDIIAQAMSGLMSTTGWPDGYPTRTGTAIGDILGGLGATIGILSAVYNCQKTGLGQKVDVALVDSVVSALEIINMIYLSEGRIPQRIGNRYEAAYPYDTFKAKDGIVVIGAANDKLWKILCDQMGTPEFANEPRFLTIPDRVREHEEIKVIVEKWTKNMKVKDIVDLLLSVGVPSAPIYDIKQVVNDPHIAIDREMFVDIKHPNAGELKITGNHIKLSATPALIRTVSPMLGENNKEVYINHVGLSEEEFKELNDEGVF